jgi:hypothetical protein
VDLLREAQKRLIFFEKFPFFNSFFFCSLDPDLKQILRAGVMSWIRSSPERFLEQSDPALEVVPSPKRQRVKLVLVHVEGHLEVGIRQVLLQVAPVHVWWHLVVAGEEEVQWVDLVIRYGRRGRGVVCPERMRRHHVETEK